MSVCERKFDCAAVLIVTEIILCPIVPFRWSDSSGP